RGLPWPRPATPLRLLGLSRAEALTHERAGGGREAEAGEERQRKHARADEVGRDRPGTVLRHEDDVDEEAELHQEMLERGGIADAKHARDEPAVEPEPRPPDHEAQAAAGEPREPDGRAHAGPHGR